MAKISETLAGANIFVDGNIFVNANVLGLFGIAGQDSAGVCPPIQATTRGGDNIFREHTSEFREELANVDFAGPKQ